MKALSYLSVLLASYTLASAQGFRVDLSGDSSTANGSGTLFFEPGDNTLTFQNIQFSGLSSQPGAIHIHGPTDALTMDAPVLYGLDDFTDFGATSGSVNGVLTLEDDVGGFTIAEQVSQLSAGAWYINVHTSRFQLGEIRGPILLVPEPSVYAVASMFVIGGWLFRRSRKRSPQP